jgi:hypothetical protein
MTLQEEVDEQRARVALLRPTVNQSFAPIFEMLRALGAVNGDIAERMILDHVTGLIDVTLRHPEVWKK